MTVTFSRAISVRPNGQHSHKPAAPGVIVTTSGRCDPAVSVALTLRAFDILVMPRYGRTLHIARSL